MMDQIFGVITKKKNLRMPFTELRTGSKYWIVIVLIVQTTSAWPKNKQVHCLIFQLNFTKYFLIFFASLIIYNQLFIMQILPYLIGTQIKVLTKAQRFLDTSYPKNKNSKYFSFSTKIPKLHTS